MKKFFVIISILILFALSGCGRIFSGCTRILYSGDRLMLSGELVSEDFNIEGSYSRLDVSSAFKVTVTDTVDHIIVTTDKNIMPKVEVKKEGDELIISLRHMLSNHGASMEVLLPYNPDLKEVELSGAADLYTDFPMKGHTVEIDLSGASNFYGDVEAHRLEMELSGASDFYGAVNVTDLELDLSGASKANIEGRTETLTLDCSGASGIVKKVSGEESDIESGEKSGRESSGDKSGDRSGEGSSVEKPVKESSGNSYAISCVTCEGSLSGASSAYIHCDGQIDVDLSGASDLHYTGIASTSGSSTSGASSLTHDVL